MKRLSLAVMALASGMTCGCAGVAQIQGWQPAIDHAIDGRPAHLSADLHACEALSAAYTGTGAGEIAASVLAGAVAGAAVGVGLFSLPTGAAGSAIGAATGSIRSGDQYRLVFGNCMRGRGHAVLN